MPEVPAARQPPVLGNYALGRWVAPTSGLVAIPSALDGRVMAQASSAGLDFAAMARHARLTGGPALRAMTFPQRADLLKALATHLNGAKEALYQLAFDTGATRRDNSVDIEGGLGVLLANASRGRRELPSEHFVIDGDVEPLSKAGGFVGLHVRTPLHGVAVHINAFNSLNAAVLGPDVAPGAPEFDLFVREVVREMTAKAGQKCTAIRRIFVPRAIEAAVIAALSAKLADFIPADPRLDATRMGALVSTAQAAAVRAAVAEIGDEVEIVHGSLGPSQGAFMAPALLRARDPANARRVHAVEPFGPVATVLAYDSLDEAIALAAKAEGSLVASLATYDADVAQAFVFGVAPYHGRLHILDRDCAKESTGHGAPMPGLVHGGPGRAGGAEELGGLRAVHRHLQTTALQGSPARLAALTRRWMKGAPAPATPQHPFRRHFEALAIGDTVETASRIVTLEDIEHFAAFTGDNFYAHMDEAAARANPFFPGRVAHGYLLLSFAAGLFVDPAPGPLLANYGLDNLRFLKPVSPGDSLRVRLTVKQKQAARKPEYGEVRWDVELFNQTGETVASYDLLTMSARGPL